MAGIGVKLNRIFHRRSMSAYFVGFGYSLITTVAPMFLVIGAILVMDLLLGFSRLGYYDRELFACTVLYTFIFSLLTASPFNAVLSRYLSDVIYEERYEDILPCFYVGLFLNIALACLLGIPFCLHEYFVGGVRLPYVFTGYCAYINLVLVFYSMLYLSICKDYGRISLFFFIGMLVSVILAVVLVKFFGVELSFAMLISLAVGFLLTASLEMAIIRSYFRENSGHYRSVFRYFRKYWQLIFTNFLYTLGLYIHNFVFWTTPLRMELVQTFICCQPYDMATCLAMFTNISSSIIFIARTEMAFHDRYKAYSEAVIGGRGMDIRISKQRMFRKLSEELMNLMRIQFMITVVVFLACVIILPYFGFGGLVMRIYPCLAAGYFVLYIMYATILYLYYFDDLKGSLITAGLFCAVTLIVSIFATKLPDIWYGVGVFAGSIAGFSFAYFRLRWMERNLDMHIFCKGRLLQKASGRKPSSKVFDRKSSAAANGR